MTNDLQVQLHLAGYDRDFTLSGLIEACGDRFTQLTRVPGLSIWSADGSEGASPEEAVARLWLALNGKP